VAKWLSTYATVQRSVLMRVPGEGLSVDRIVLRYALSTSIAVLGGREQGPAGHTLDKLVDACRLDTPWKMTAGRVLIDRRRSGLYLCRESRNLPSLTLNAGEIAVWDGRFRLVNRGAEPLSLVPARNPEGAAGLFGEVPPSIALRAAGVLPPEPAEGFMGTATEGFFSRPLLAPFDRFLPQFDLSVAGAFAKLMGCDHFAPVPIEDSVRKR
jgi:tRNA(Ile)-lysidine synthase